MSKFIKFSKQLLEFQSLYVLREIGRQVGVKSPSSTKREDLIEKILLIQSGKLEPVEVSKQGAPSRPVDVSMFYLEEIRKPIGIEQPDESVIKMIESAEKHASSKIVFNESPLNAKGVLEITQNGYGFLRNDNFLPSDDDVYVSIQMIRNNYLKNGDYIEGEARSVQSASAPSLQKINKLNGKKFQVNYERAKFDNLTAYYPTEKISLSTENNDTLNRIIDLFAPLGFGQRGLIVAPPKTGKTTVIKKVADAIVKNYPKAKLFVLLVDERPEEVTDILRSVKGEIGYSTFDKAPENHIRVAELLLESAKRLVENGEDVVILMDSITKLARAYNNTVESSGKTLTGGVNPTSLVLPKKIFGSARNVIEGGSLTIISTALIETGSRMDEVIYEEFKGTGNMEIHLSRALSERRIFPAIDILKSGTRKEELLLSEEELKVSYKLRKLLANKKDATETLIDIIENTSSNKELINRIDEIIKENN